jgi:membrane-associated phospholipid phosphatase
MLKRVLWACIALSIPSTRISADVVTDWNDQWMNAIRQAPAGPPVMARSGAMVMTSIYNAVNAVDQTHQPYGGFNVTGAPGTSREAAAAQAAHDVMQHLYPAQSAQWTAQLTTSLAPIPNGAGKTAGIQLGMSSASHMIALRTNDGTQLPENYLAGGNPGDYVNPNGGNPNFGVNPNAGNFTTWAMTSGSQFRPGRLSSYGTMANFLASQEYADNYNDVKMYGRVNSWTPADEEYQIAFFWANDRDGTYKPLGHLFDITQTIADRELASLTADERLSANARLFALVGLAMADAGIAAWDCKYNTDFDLWRPITAIRRGSTDGNANTIEDLNWEPLNHVDPDGAGSMLPDPFTPPFPAYISGHATFGAAHAEIMRNYFGDNDIIQGGPLTIGTDDPYVVGLTRTFTSWADMARENGRSRIYLGVHYQFDADDAYTTGTGLANLVFNNYLLPIPEPATGGLWMAAVALFAGRRCFR